MSVVSHIHEATFPTPLLELQSISEESAQVLLKAEFLAPLGNLEDRWALLGHWMKKKATETPSPPTFSPVYSQERMAGLAQVSASCKANVIAVSTQEAQDTYAHLIKRFDSRIAPVASDPSETVDNWTGEFFATSAFPHGRTHLLRNIQSMVDEIRNDLHEKSIHLHIPWILVAPFPEEARQALYRATPDVTFSWVWWRPSNTGLWSNVKHPQEDDIRIVSRHDALLMTVKLAQDYGLLVTVPSGAVVVSALQQAASDKTETVHIAVACRLYNVEENHNPFARAINKYRHDSRSAGT